MKASEKNAVVVADANVILAAIVGLAAGKAFLQPITVYISAAALSEVIEYMGYFCGRYNVPVEVARRQLSALPMIVKSREFYEDSWAEAEHLMKIRDPDDIDTLALAVKLNAPVWSNDDHFKDLPVKRYTTAQFLKHLGF